EAPVREVVLARARGLRAHGHDGGHALRRDRQEVPGEVLGARDRGRAACGPPARSRTGDSRHVLLSSLHHISSSTEMGAWRPFFVIKAVETGTEQQLVG